MTLKCKKGDVARIVGVQDALSELRDHFVTCVELYHLAGEPHWRIDRRIDFVLLANGRSTFTGQRFFMGEPLWIDSMPDKYLQPIRGGERDGETVRDIINGELAPRRQVEHAR